jgi:hypothetical protein
MKAIEKVSRPSNMRVWASCSHLPHVPVFDLDTSLFFMGKVGFGDGIKVREEVPPPRLLALPSRLQGDVVRGWYGIAILLAVFVAWHDGSHDDVQWYAGVSEIECTFEDELTLNGSDEDPFWWNRRLRTIIL